MMRRSVWRAVATGLLVVPLGAFASPAGAKGSNGQTYAVSSPDRKITVEFELNPSGTPLYRVSHDGAPLVADSALGFQFENAPPLKSDLDVRSVRRDRRDTVWRPVWGKYKTIRNHYNALTLDLREQRAPRRALQLEFRVFDDGVGFRYTLPRQRAMGAFAITSEDTSSTSPAISGLVDPAQYGPGSGDENLWTSTPLTPRWMPRRRR